MNETAKLSSAKKKLAIAVLLFSVVNVLVKFLSDISPFQIIWFRGVITFLLIFTLMKVQRISFRSRHKKTLFLRGLFGTIGMWLYFWSLHLLPLSTAVSLHYLNPVFTIILAGPLVGEAVPKIFIPAFLVCSFGVFMLENFNAAVSWQGVLVALSANVFAAFAYNFIRKLKGKAHPYLIVLWFSLVTLPLVSPFMIAQWKSPTLFQTSALLAIGLLTSLAQILMTQAYQNQKAYLITQVTYFGILLSCAFGIFFFDEKLGVFTIVGVSLIFLGLLWLNWLKRKTKA